MKNSNQVFVCVDTISTRTGTITKVVHCTKKTNSRGESTYTNNATNERVIGYEMQPQEIKTMLPITEHYLRMPEVKYVSVDRQGQETNRIWKFRW